MQEQLQDTDIIRAVLQGRKADYAILVGRYQSFVFTITSRYIKNREEAEEVAQDIFVKAYLSLAGFKGNSKFSTWLYSITHTTCISHLRKHKPNTLLIDNDKLVVYSDSQYHSTNVPAGTGTQKQAINEALKQLPDDDAEIITLFYLAEQSIEEIAVITGLQTNNVKVKLYRARQKLKDIIEHTYGKEAALLYRN